jgi:UDP-GlcNAc3NAcA epimerase
MKIVTIVGARPQFVKASCLSRLLKKEKDITEVIVHTGQHFDFNMSSSFFDELDIPQPKYNLDVHSLSHGAMTGRMIEKIEEILVKEKPNVVIVYGDTDSTLAGALATIKLHIPVCHIEAGMRSYNMNMPEEINRILTDHVSTILCCSSESAKEILERENMTHNIFVVGDIMYDSFLYAQNKMKKSLIGLPAAPKKYCLLTLHREENTDDIEKLKTLFIDLTEVGHKYDVMFVFPAHPRLTKMFIINEIPGQFYSKIKFIDPVSYMDMIALEKHSKIILTDSGGVQKESYWNEVPCITLREETEWIELVDAKVNITTGLHRSKILDAFEHFMSNEINFPKDLYGDGNSAKKILDVLKLYF